MDTHHISEAAAQEAVGYAGKAHTLTEWLLGIIPDSFLGPFAGGEILQVLFLSILVGIAVATMIAAARWVGRAARKQRRTRKKPATGSSIASIGSPRSCSASSHSSCSWRPWAPSAPWAYAVGKNGPQMLLSLAKLMACVYTTMLVFIVCVLGLILRLCGVSLWRYLVYIRDEILLVLGTSSSESALPRMIQKMQNAGCGREVAGLVIPAGYSFNLDGAEHRPLAALLLSPRALLGKEPTNWHQIEVLGVLLLTSKGAAAVTGGGFITLSATLGTAQATRDIPIEGPALVLGVDRFMSEARAITNLIGNGVAAIAVSRMEGEFDLAKFRAAAANPDAAGSSDPAPFTAG